MHVTTQFVTTAITSQGLNNLALWNAGRTAKILFHTGTPAECVAKFEDAVEWIEGSFVVEAWADGARSAKGGRPTTAGEKCTWMVKGRAGQAAPVQPMPRGAVPDGSDVRLLQLLERLEQRIGQVEQSINGLDADDEPEVEQLPAWVEDATKRGIGLVERLADHFIFKGNGQTAVPPAAAAQPIQGAEDRSASAEWMELNRALKRLQRSDPKAFEQYRAMLLQVYGDAAAQAAQSQAGNG